LDINTSNEEIYRPFLYMYWLSLLP